MARTRPSSQTFPMPRARARDGVPICSQTVPADFFGTSSAEVRAVGKAAATRAPFGARGLGEDSVAPPTRMRNESVSASA